MKKLSIFLFENIYSFVSETDFSHFSYQINIIIIKYHEKVELSFFASMFFLNNI